MKGLGNEKKMSTYKSYINIMLV